MGYPNDLDSFPTYEDRDIAHGIEGTLVVNAMFAIIHTAVVAVETVLGTLPQGAQATVRQRLENIEAVKLNLSGGDMTGDILMDGHNVDNAGLLKGDEVHTSSIVEQVGTVDFIGLDGTQIEFRVGGIRIWHIFGDRIRMIDNFWIRLNTAEDKGLRYNTAQAVIEFDGDVRLNDNLRVVGEVEADTYIKIGSGALPAADASYRGKMIRVEGGAGVADVLYICMKSAADTYSWVTVATG